MASLLREQTRVKESLEGALERQKEGTLLFDNNCPYYLMFCFQI